MQSKLFSLAATMLFLISASATAQVPAAGPEFDVLKNDAGVWDAKIKMWSDAGEPEASEGVETNTMIGEFWLVSDFESQMMGLPFKGHGVFGYHTQLKKHTGFWVDNFSPNGMHMEGGYDQATHTMTYTGVGMGPDGNSVKHVLTTVYKDDGTRMFTLYTVSNDGTETMTKVMEVIYTKR